MFSHKWAAACAVLALVVLAACNKVSGPSEEPFCVSSDRQLGALDAAVSDASVVLSWAVRACGDFAANVTVQRYSGRIYYYELRNAGSVSWLRADRCSKGDIPSYVRVTIRDRMGEMTKEAWYSVTQEIPSGCGDQRPPRHPSERD